MMWNKIKIAVAMMGVLGLAGTGAGWLTRGRVAAETPPPAAKPPLNQSAQHAATPEPEEKTKNEIGKIHDELNALAAAEEIEESRLAEKAIDARLRAIECQDQLHVREKELSAEDTRMIGRIRVIEINIATVRAILDDLAVKKAANSRSAESMKLKMKTLETEAASLRKQERDRSEYLRSYRKHLFQAEEALRRIETKQVRQREIAAAKREALLTRLQQLEEMSRRRDPNNRLRDMERKLDALRRDVTELRRSLERPKKP